MRRSLVDVPGSHVQLDQEAMGSNEEGQAMTAKLCKGQRLKIMQLHEQRVQNIHIAERYGVAPGTISRIIKEDLEVREAQTTTDELKGKAP
jgi:hypothetical protein